MNYNFYFKTEKDASYFINQALEIAKVYGSVRLSDLHDIRGGWLLVDYTSNKIGWTASSITNRVYTKIDSVLERYIVTFPEPDFNENNPNFGHIRKEIAYMKNITNEDLKEILEKHSLWLKNDPEGVRAYLTGADLYGADLSRADLTGATNIKFPTACPEEGSFIGFKKASGNYIIKLEIPEDALRCSATGRKCRCSKAKVISITNIDGTDANVNEVFSKYDTKFVYRVGDTVSVCNFNPNRWEECAPGIHFFITRQEAVEY